MSASFPYTSGYLERVVVVVLNRTAAGTWLDLRPDGRKLFAGISDSVLSCNICPGTDVGIICKTEAGGFCFWGTDGSADAPLGNLMQRRLKPNDAKGTGYLGYRHDPVGDGRILSE